MNPAYAMPEGKMKKLIVIIPLLFSLSQVALATPQEHDVVIYKNIVYASPSYPLESYYRDEKYRPTFRQAPNMLSSSSNTRGYVAHWEIESDTLYLRGIRTWVCDSQDKCERADLEQLFGNKCVKGKVEATWYSGELRLSDGYGSEYERDIILTVEFGKVVKKETIDNQRKKTGS
jgi:hypothetical protein